MSNQTQMVKIAINKSILKEYKDSLNERIVYLDNGSEFQIQIFNPCTYVVGAKIYINGVLMPYMLVLKPGERIWLERYLDKSVKFKFETYEVDADEETKKAIQNNGEVKVVFYKEVQYATSVSPFNWGDIQPLNYTDRFTTISGNNIYYSERSATSNNISNDDLNNFYLNSTCDKGVNSVYTSLSDGVTAEYSMSRGSVKSDQCRSTSPIHRKFKAFNDDKIETGRIEEGGYSAQRFENVYRNFSTWSFATETIKLMPISQKQYNSNDLKKRYCTQCGRKIHAKHKYCPYCGHKVE